MNVDMGRTVRMSRWRYWNSDTDQLYYSCTYCKGESQVATNARVYSRLDSIGRHVGANLSGVSTSGA